MMIGKFNEKADGYTGSIQAVGLSLSDVTFSPVPAKRGNGPDFVLINNDGTGPFEAGAAWKKTSKEGKPYLSVKLDGPALAAPINCALTRQQDGSYALVWSRRDKDEDQDAAGEQAAA